MGLVLRLKDKLESKGFTEPVNETALRKHFVEWGIDLDELRAMVDLFAASPRRYLKGDEVPWIGFVRQREALRADAGKVSQAADPTAKFRTG